MWRASGPANPDLDPFVRCQVSLQSSGDAPLPPVGEGSTSDVLLGAALKPGLNLGC